MLSVVLLSTLALGQDFVTDVGEPQIWEQGGVWSRPLPTADGWVLAHGTQNDLFVAPLVEGELFGEWDLDREHKTNLTQRGNLKDHSIKRCPDGSYLVASSANLEGNNDSSYWTHVDADFNQLATGAIEEANHLRAHNDLVALCAPDAQGVLHSEFGQGEDFDSTLFIVDFDAGVGATHTLTGFKSEGGALVYDSASGGYVGAHVSLGGQGFMTRFDEDFVNIEQRAVDFGDGPWIEHWPQGLVRIGEHFLVATLARDHERYGPGDGDGDVWLVVVDADFAVVERHRLSEFLEEGDGASRPWVDRKGSQALVGFDRGVRHGLIEVALDLGAFGVGGGMGGGTGGGDGAMDDTAAEDADGDPEGCGGCTSLRAPLGLVGVVAGLALCVGRRRA